MTEPFPPRVPQATADLAALFDLTEEPAVDTASDAPQPREASGWRPPEVPPGPQALAPEQLTAPGPEQSSDSAQGQGLSLQPRNRDLPPELTAPSAYPAPQQAAQQAPPAHPGPAHTGTLDRRISDAARLWPIVDQVLSAVGSDPTLQVLMANLELWTDPAEDAKQRQEFYHSIKPRLALAGVQIPDPRDVEPVLAFAYDEILGISVIGDLWRDPSVTEVMVDRWDRIIIERDGRLEQTPLRFRDAEHANAIARSLALRVSDRAVSRSIPLVTAELPQARVQFAYGPVVKGGLSITIRKFRDLLTLDQLLAYRSLSPDMVEFLRDAVEARAGILVSGGTGSGKTTIINLLSSFIPDSERVITIEDAFELQLGNTHVVSLQTKEASSADDTVDITLAALLRSTLRMRPDRIIVGEIREGDGAQVMLSAANTGHDGTMTTIHANSPNMAINERLVDLIRQVRGTSDDLSVKRSIASAFELVVQVTRAKDGRRYLSDIDVVGSVGTDGLIRLAPIFRAETAPDGSPVFRRFGVPEDCELAARLEEKGVMGRWGTPQG